MFFRGNRFNASGRVCAIDAGVHRCAAIARQGQNRAIGYLAEPVPRDRAVDLLLVLANTRTWSMPAVPAQACRSWPARNARHAVQAGFWSCRRRGQMQPAAA